MTLSAAEAKAKALEIVRGHIQVCHEDFNSNCANYMIDRIEREIDVGEEEKCQCHFCPHARLHDRERKDESYMEPVCYDCFGPPHSQNPDMTCLRAISDNYRSLAARVKRLEGR